ncbi:hypothetical protein LTR86_008191 [Recurvomyces mirabilis]|nr:hypothetical protein LTR86_008191 [Recurvomyces mirabilis]
MSINWVMLSPSATPPFTPLPNETILFTSPPRTGLNITTPGHYPAKQQKPYSLAHASGILYLTNRRIIYLPDKPTPTFQSFAAPILNLHDSHVTAPFFGPNVWMALLQPTSGGGIPVPVSGVVEMKLTFKEGGAFDFHTGFERVKERLGQAMEVGRMGESSGSDAASRSTGHGMPDVDLDDLPAYQEESSGPLLSPVMVAPPPPPAPSAAVAATTSAGPRQRQSRGQRDSGIAVEDDRAVPKPTDQAFPPPDEPPPGYEEAQMAGVQEEIERRASGGR